MEKKYEKNKQTGDTYSVEAQYADGSTGVV